MANNRKKTKEEIDAALQACKARYQQEQRAARAALHQLHAAEEKKQAHVKYILGGELMRHPEQLALIADAISDARQRTTVSAWLASRKLSTPVVPAAPITPGEQLALPGQSVS